MDDYESLSHSKWECKYHVVFIPKCRRKTLYGELRRHLGEVFRKLAMQKECKIEEGHLMPDHVHIDDLDSSQIRRLPGRGVHQGQERDPSGSGLWGEEAQFRGTALLGQRVRRLDSRSRRSDDQGVHQKAGRGGCPPRPDEPVALISRLQAAPIHGVASATPTAALSGPIPKAPGFAGGYLLTG